MNKVRLKWSKVSGSISIQELYFYKSCHVILVYSYTNKVFFTFNITKFSIITIILVLDFTLLYLRTVYIDWIN